MLQTQTSFEKWLGLVFYGVNISHYKYELMCMYFDDNTRNIE